MTVDTEKYLEFVEGVTSNESLHYASLIARTNNLELEDDCNVPQLLTAALGLTAESGEFTEIVKKIILQGKPYNEDNVFHMKRELGDICWYIAQACMALDTSFDESTCTCKLCGDFISSDTCTCSSANTSRHVD